MTVASSLFSCVPHGGETFSTAGRAKRLQPDRRKEKKAVRPPGTDIRDEGDRGSHVTQQRDAVTKLKKIIIAWILCSVRKGGIYASCPAGG